METARQPYVRCKECPHRAVIDWRWKPTHGQDPLMRQFRCTVNKAHETYKVFTRAELYRLADSR